MTLSYEKSAADLPKMAESLTRGESDVIADLANVSALVYDVLPDLNWVGFYLLKGGELVLGPFQGKPACIRLKIGKGVCGTAVAENRTVVVEDVHKFAGHVACDERSRSEMVVPLRKNGEIVGVFDLDSPIVGRFAEIADVIEKTAAVVEGFL